VALSISGSLAALGHTVAGDEILKNFFANFAFSAAGEVFGFHFPARGSSVTRSNTRVTGGEYTRLVEQLHVRSRAL
jgi:hypothetical protein